VTRINTEREHALVMIDFLPFKGGDKSFSEDSPHARRDGIADLTSDIFLRSHEFEGIRKTLEASSLTGGY
jgi:hypothetical protein